MKIKSLTTEQRFSNEKMQKVNLFETERMFADIYCLEPGQEQKPHSHNGADKVYVVLQGSGRFRIGEQEQDVTIEQAVLAPAGVEHGVRNTSSARLVLLVFMAPNPNYG
jgi:mannose-6-phosphate isomerase-like protein (cupin superfamily)